VKKSIKLTLVLLTVAVISGCVSAGRYNQKEQEAFEYRTKAESLAHEKQVLENILTNLNKEKDQLIEEKMTLSDELTELESNIDHLRREKTALDSDLVETRNEIADLNKEKEELAELARERENRIEQLKSAREKMENELRTEMEKGQITISGLKDKLTLNIVDKLLFDSGVADIKDEGRDVIQRIGEQLKTTSGYKISIEGHTDNVGISKELQKKFPSNWELSVTRATNVVRFLIHSADINPSDISASGFADTQPIASNDNPEGREKNRRIEIVLVPGEIKRVPEK